MMITILLAILVGALLVSSARGRRVAVRLSVAVTLAAFLFVYYAAVWRAAWALHAWAHP